MSALWVNLFFQTPLNYCRITLQGEVQGDVVIMTVMLNRFFDRQGVHTKTHVQCESTLGVFSKLHRDCKLLNKGTQSTLLGRVSLRG